MAFCVSGVSAAAPAVNITCTTTPLAPTDFEITQIGVGSINITWTKGTGANVTIVRGSTVGYPYSIFDGNAIYSGNGTWVAVGSLDLATYTYYYRAWSQNSYGTSADYDQDSIGHGAGDDDDDTGTLSLTSFSLTGDGFGLLEMMLVIAFLALAIWKRSWIRITLSLCVIIWAIFAAQYDIKVALPLLAISTILFFMGILRMIQQRRAEAAESEG